MNFKYLIFLLIFSACHQTEKKSIAQTTQVTNTSVSLAMKNLVLGKFNYTKHPDFQKISALHASKSIYLNKETYQAFIKMYNAAKQEHVQLQIVSATRNFYAQKSIWERKWKKYSHLPPLQRAKKILEYSSMPTTSRHHWGTDIDLNNLNNSYFDSGKGLKVYNWLVTNANDYGFYQVYTSKNAGRTGYNLEKWHWSYTPLANKYLRFYNKHINYEDIKGFNGAELAKDINMITDYVNGISPQILKKL